MVGYLTSIWRCRYFWLSLVKMDLRTRYRRSVLGLGWSLLHPILMTVVLCTVFHRIFGVNIRDYAPTLMAGLAFWNYFTTAALQGCHCFVQSEAYIRQYPSPLAIFPLRAALGAGVHFLLALVMVAVLGSYATGGVHVLALLSLVPTLVLLLVFGWGVALLAGIVNTIFHDTEHLMTVAFQILFYATPIIYTDDALRANGLMWVMRWNPLVPFLSLLRDPIVRGEIPQLHGYLAAGCTTLVVTGGAALLLNQVQRRFIFYL